MELPAITLGVPGELNSYRLQYSLCQGNAVGAVIF